MILLFFFASAKAIGIDKQTWKGWMKKYSPDWTLVPPQIKVEIKAEEKKYRETCSKRLVPAKHKYCYILGRGKKETKFLLAKFAENSPNKQNIPYPTIRGK